MVDFPHIPSEFKKVPLRDDLFKILPIDLVREFKAFIFDYDENKKWIFVAAVDPRSKNLSVYFKNTFQGKVKWYYAEEEDIDHILENYNRNFKEEIEDLVSRDIDRNDTTTRLIDMLLNYALAEKASDVHIEPSAENTVVRFRIDGILHKVTSFPQKAHQAVVARFKILGNLKIDESRRPQEGRIEIQSKPGTLFRISTVPTLTGEKVVLRVMDDSNKELELRTLGFSPDQEEMILRNIEKPYGMILASGPTGAGKTTTLYALLQLIKKDGVNVSTLEDPIEYGLKGVNQVQINPRVELSFASGLRSILRQDPDIVMVGEIRDSETAIMASDAAMTGHLVFSTVHTNNAPSVFVRLLEMGVEDFVIASTVNFIIAQRLVRKVCQYCSKPRTLDDFSLRKTLARSDILSILENEYGLDKNSLKDREFQIGVGCDNCFHSGYSGRIGIYELLELNKEIHDLILAKKSSEEIREAVEKTGFIDMVNDGVKKVMDGTTTFDEVIRTTKDI